MDDALEKLQILSGLIKAILSKPGSAALVPAIKPPKALTPPPMVNSAPKKLPGVTPPSNKDPKKMAEQLKNPRPKKVQMEVLKTASNGQWSLEKEDKYRIHVDGHPVTEPMHLKDIVTNHGPVQHIESKPNFKVVPVKPPKP